MRFRGIVYRAHDPRWSWPPVSGEGARLNGGRFNRLGVPAFYTSLSPVTALREASPLRQPMQPVLLCAYEVDAEPIFDTLDSSQRTRHAVADVELRCPDWEQKMLDGGIPASHALAERLVAAVTQSLSISSPAHTITTSPAHTITTSPTHTITT